MPPNTGKSYAVSCIDFVLGAKDPPEEISQARGYTVVYLAIETRAGEPYTLKRALVGGPIGMYAGGLDAALEDDSAEWASLGVTIRATESVSKFLLGLCGLDGRRVRSNNTGATQALSFRVLAKSLIVDEQRVIAKRSPIYGTQNATNTAAASTLRLLVTGHDDSEIVPPKDKKTAAGRLAGQKETVEGLIQKDKALLAELTAGEEGAHTQQAMEELEAMLGQLSTSVSRLVRPPGGRAEPSSQLDRPPTGAAAGGGVERLDRSSRASRSALPLRPSQVGGDGGVRAPPAALH